jgi:hypothetical protein
MKLIGALGVILGGAMIIGCGQTTPSAKAPVETIGTATLTAASVPEPLLDEHPLFLTDDLAGNRQATPAPARTWGAAASAGSAEDDLARNPYTQRDIYDPN